MRLSGTQVLSAFAAQTIQQVYAIPILLLSPLLRFRLWPRFLPRTTESEIVAELKGEVLSVIEQQCEGRGYDQREAGGAKRATGTRPDTAKPS